MATLDFKGQNEVDPPHQDKTFLANSCRSERDSICIKYLGDDYRYINANDATVVMFDARIKRLESRIRELENK